MLCQNSRFLTNKQPSHLLEEQKTWKIHREKERGWKPIKHQ